jgi:hypothetical protein
MKTKHKVGDLVRTAKDYRPTFSGVIEEIIYPSKDLQLLWGSKQPHYLVKDTKMSEYLSVIERGLERV